MDRALLPCPLGHYGGEAHALHRAGLGGTPPEAMGGVPGCVGEASPKGRIPEDGGELPGGEGDPGPREEGGSVRGGWELSQSAIPYRDRAL